MKSERLAARMRALCAELGPDDGIDPRELDKSTRSPSDPHRRHRRLGAQIQRAVALALGTATDPALQTLWVAAAVADPDASRFRIEVEPLDPVDPVHLAARLAAAAPWIRVEVASALHRRRVPELVWVVVAGRQP